MRIFLIGYMAAGKTTFGKQLAARMKMDFTDTDEYIERKFGITINELFKERGEANFREMERAALEELCKRDNIVIATGGGLPCFGDNMDYIKQAGVSVYLKASAETLASRLETLKATRPLLKDKSRDELLQTVTAMLTKREPYYNRADIIIDTTDWHRVIEMIQLSVSFQ